MMNLGLKKYLFPDLGTKERKCLNSKLWGRINVLVQWKSCFLLKEL